VASASLRCEDTRVAIESRRDGWLDSRNNLMVIRRYRIYRDLTRKLSLLVDLPSSAT